MQAHLQSLAREAGLPAGLPIEIDQWSEAPRLAADDRDHQRKTERAGADERLGRAADAQPDRQRILQRPGVHTLSGQRSAVLAGPVHMLVLTDVQQQLELLFEQRVVVVQAEAEEWECVDERSATDDHLGP